MGARARPASRRGRTRTHKRESAPWADSVSLLPSYGSDPLAHRLPTRDPKEVTNVRVAQRQLSRSSTPPPPPPSAARSSEVTNPSPPPPAAPLRRGAPPRRGRDPAAGGARPAPRGAGGSPLLAQPPLQGVPRRGRSPARTSASCSRSTTSTRRASPATSRRSWPTARDDLHRSRLAENLWEEGGGLAPEQRHAEIFRRFLRTGWTSTSTTSTSSTRPASSCGSTSTSASTRTPRPAPRSSRSAPRASSPGCTRRSSTACSRPGVAEEHLAFFRIHMECDDEHAETLERHHDELRGACPTGTTPAIAPWITRSACGSGSSSSSTTRIEARRVRGILDAIQRGESLAPERPDAAEVRHRVGTPGLPLYAQRQRAARRRLHGGAPALQDGRVRRAGAPRRAAPQQRAAQAPARVAVLRDQGPRARAREPVRPSRSRRATWCSCRAGRCTSRTTWATRSW